MNQIWVKKLIKHISWIRVVNKSIMYIYQLGNNKIFKLGKGIKLSKILSPGKSKGK